MAETLFWDYQIVHWLPGRVRLRIPSLFQAQAVETQLAQWLTQQSVIKGFRINRRAASVVLFYALGEGLPWLGIEGEPGQIELEPPVSTPTDALPANRPASFLAQASGLVLPGTATVLALLSYQFNYPWLRWLARGSLGLAAVPVAQRAIASLIEKRQLNIDCLDLLALILSGLQGKLVTPALVLSLHELGDLIREQTARATEYKTASLLDTLGRFAWVKRHGELVQIPSDQVLVGETVIVYPGERIPVDGRVLTGSATVDQQQLTGEAMPIVAIPGTEVYAATLVRSGQIHLQCERVGQNTRAAISVELLAKAPVHDTRMANYAAKLADKLILPSLVLAGLVWGISRDPARAASILTLDFVTGIRVSMPTAFLGALNHTTRHGILVRSGRTLELLGQINTIVFDKTGTLTQGNITVVAIQTAYPHIAPERVLQLAASAEQRITHPVAEAILQHAKSRGIPLLPREKWQYQIGYGMTAKLEGSEVYVGSEKFLEQKGIEITSLALKADGSSPWQSSVEVAADGQWLGTIIYSDPLRSDSVDLIATLQNRYGMEVHLLTGDNPERAHQVAQVLKIPVHQVHAEAFPEQKAKIVRDLRRSGQVVAFVGDGLNDSVALAYADVSISFADGSDIARETADVVLMNNHLSGILEAIAIARETQNVIEQNTLLVVAPNLLGVGLAATIGLNPLFATLIHNGTAIAAGLNSLRPLLKHQLETA